MTEELSNIPDIEKVSHSFERRNLILIEKLLKRLQLISFYVYRRQGGSLRRYSTMTCLMERGKKAMTMARNPMRLMTAFCKNLWSK